MSQLRITTGTNPYSLEVQGKANEPICVLNLLLRAERHLGLACEATQADIVERLDANAPRIAIIGGSPDHPAHVVDYETILKAAVAIWQRGGVPFSFGIPVMCDGTAQSTVGMCYSLESRNTIAQIVVNQMESHAYHGAFVIQGCDKTPFAVVCGLALLDRVRQNRGEAPVFASFAPAHVLRGGTVPEPLQKELLALAERADQLEEGTLGDDLRMTLQHILQCSSNQAFQGIFTRMVQAGILTPEQHKNYEKQLAAHTCHIDGGICAFNGTGNSCRHTVSALGLVHPTLELLAEPPSYEQIDEAIAVMLKNCNDNAYSVSNLVLKNLPNAICIHSATGGSTNLMMHLIAAVIYAGKPFSIHAYDELRRQMHIPDLINYSLMEGRDIFALAQQVQKGLSGGMTTVLYELKRNGIPVMEEALTMAGCTWEDRLRDGAKISADRVKENPVLLSKPHRATSGVDVLQGNFFDSAVVKISGMPETQLDWFDDKIALVLYFENEDEAVESLLNYHLLDKIKQESWICKQTLLQIHRHNTSNVDSDLSKIDCPERLFQTIAAEGALRIALVIAGQGPEAFGMPEMFTPMQHLNHNQTLKKICTILSDGRYSGVSYGAAIGHITPEAYRKGGILYLQSGDLLHLQLRKRQIQLIDTEAFQNGSIAPFDGNLAAERDALGIRRWQTMQKRRGMICPSNHFYNVTDAAHGVIPQAIWDWADSGVRREA